MEKAICVSCQQKLRANSYVSYIDASLFSNLCSICSLMFNILFQVEVEFSDGCACKLSAEFLRVYSPAADSKIRSVGGEKVTFGICCLGHSLLNYFWFLVHFKNYYYLLIS